MTTASACGIMVCLYHLPCVCHTLVPKISVHPEMLHAFGILTFSCAWFTTALDWTADWTAKTTGISRVCHENYWWRQVGECTDTLYKQIQPTKTVELLLLGNLPMRHLCQSETINGLDCTAVLWHSYQHRYDTTLTTVPACELWMENHTYRQTDHWHYLLCKYCHKTISSGSLPVFLECT